MSDKSLLMAVLMIIASVAGRAEGALIPGTLLNFNAGLYTCTNPSATYPNCGTQGYYVSSGSYFGLDGDGNGIVTTDASESEAIAPGPDGGILIGATQDTNGHVSHAGAAHPGTGGLDAEWDYYGYTGMHFTTASVVVVNDYGATKELDFSGWAVTWNGATTPLGKAGLATITCSSVSCSAGSAFVLDYSTFIPPTAPGAFSNILYTVHLEGCVASAEGCVVPLPAAVWLLGSGLIGLMGLARRKLQVA